MKLFLAVDGGQTTTKVVVADEQGRIVGAATGGPSNHTEEPGGPERLEQVVRSTVNEALGIAGLGSIVDREFEAACFGMTGETVVKRRVLQPMIKARRLEVVHDSVNALMGATAGRPGLIVIAGTGSVSRGMDGRGREIRAGGWGHLFGDEGSAYGIAREAIRAIAAELDGFGPPTGLTPLLLKRLGVTSAYELMEKYYSAEWSRDHMAGLAVWVNESASAGDPVAERILKEAGTELASFAIALFRILFKEELTHPSPDPPIVSYTGGVFENSFVLTSFKEAILASYAGARIEPPLLPPVFGSLLLAHKSSGLACPGEARREWTDASLKAGPARRN